MERQMDLESETLSEVLAALQENGLESQEAPVI